MLNKKNVRIFRSYMFFSLLLLVPFWHLRYQKSILWWRFCHSAACVPPIFDCHYARIHCGRRTCCFSAVCHLWSTRLVLRSPRSHHARFCHVYLLLEIVLIFVHSLGSIRSFQQQWILRSVQTTFHSRSAIARCLRECCPLCTWYQSSAQNSCLYNPSSDSLAGGSRRSECFRWIKRSQILCTCYHSCIRKAIPVRG